MLVLRFDSRIYDFQICAEIIAYKERFANKKSLHFADSFCNVQNLTDYAYSSSDNISSTLISTSFRVRFQSLAFIHGSTVGTCMIVVSFSSDS